jgi:hypothetical protein
MSLGGFTEDGRGAFDWAPPDDVFAFIIELMRSAGTYLHGRRMFETLPYGRRTPPWACIQTSRSLTPERAGGRQGRLLVNPARTSPRTLSSSATSTRAPVQQRRRPASIPPALNHSVATAPDRQFRDALDEAR